MMILDDWPDEIPTNRPLRERMLRARDEFPGRIVKIAKYARVQDARKAVRRVRAGEPPEGTTWEDWEMTDGTHEGDVVIVVQWLGEG